MSPSEEVSIREYLERILQERDRLSETRFKALERIIDERNRQVEVKLNAQKESVSAAFLASEKANLKVEEAQKDYNVLHNDLGRKMDAQYKEMMPRADTLELFKVWGETVEERRLYIDGRLENQRVTLEKSIDTLSQEVVSLREARSASQARTLGAATLWSYVLGILGFLALLSDVLLRLLGK